MFSAWGNKRAPFDALFCFNSCIFQIMCGLYTILYPAAMKMNEGIFSHIYSKNYTNTA